MPDDSFGWLRPPGRTGGGLVAEEIDEEFRDAGGFFVLEPMRGVSEGVQFAGVTIAKAVVSHFGDQEGVALAPEDARGNVDRGVREFAPKARGGAVPVDHGG